MRWKAAIAITLAALLGLGSVPGSSGNEDVVQNGIPGTLGLTEIAGGLSNPIGMFNAGDGSDRLFIIEQRGTIRVIDGGVMQPGFWMDLRAKVSCCGERGLLGLAFHPDFETNGIFFVSYTAAGNGQSVLERYTVDASGDPVMSSAQVFLTQAQPFSNHNGGNIKFGPDGYLYFGLGDGGSGGDPQGNAQNPNTLLGKMVRIDVDQPDPNGRFPYSVPSDNPFVNGGGRPEIWALGLRNPWRWSFDRATGDLWIADVGQNLIEEVNLVPAGMGSGWNFGWKNWEGHYSYVFPSSPLGYVFPVTEYAHFPHCSVTGGYVYRGPSETLQGMYLYGDYCSGVLWGAVGAPFTEEVIDATGHVGAYTSVPLMATFKSITSFGEGEDGHVYLVHYGGAVYRIDAP